MSIYRFPSPSLIDEVTFVTNAAGGVRAYLHARDGADPQMLANIQKQFLWAGLRAVPLQQDGKAVLEVRGFKYPERLLPNLATQGAITGTPTISEQPGDTPTKEERRKNLTLKATGLIYNIGDLAYLTYAIKEHLINRNDANLSLQNRKELYSSDVYNIVGGVGYATGSTFLSVYGSKDQSKYQIRDALSKIREYLARDGIKTGDTPAAEAYFQPDQRSLGTRLNDTFSRYPSETLNSVYVGVGGAITTSSLKRVKALKAEGKPITSDMMDIGLGVNTALAGLVGVLVKEKKPLPGDEPKHGLARAWQWIQEKPLRATGIGYFISTMWHAAATVQKYREGDTKVRQTAIFRGIFVAANILSEALLFVSSKGHGVGVKNKDVDSTVIAATAELIANQPPERREQLIDQLSGYMASADVLGSKADDVAAELRAQLKAREHSPWTRAVHPALAHADTDTKVELKPETKGSGLAVDVNGNLVEQEHTEKPGSTVSHVSHQARATEKSTPEKPVPHEHPSERWADDAHHERQHRENAVPAMA